MGHRRFTSPLTSEALHYILGVQERQRALNCQHEALMQRVVLLNKPLVVGSEESKMAARMRETLKKITFTEMTDDSDVFAAAFLSNEFFVVSRYLEQWERTRQRNNPDAHVENYVKTVVPRYTDWQFKGHFRMYPDEFEMQQCDDMYRRIQFHLTSRAYTNTQFPLLRSLETTSLSNVSSGRLMGVESAPPWASPGSVLSLSPRRRQDVGRESRAELDAREGETQKEAIDPCIQEEEGLRMNPLELSQHLRSQGLGEPQLTVSSHRHRLGTTQVPQGLKARALPRNPSLREKIKGRARLDYEIANMKALAFCEEHRVSFRTASAHMRSRDIRFVEEEMRERVQKEQRNIDGEGGIDLEGSDEEGSIVASPLTRVELFDRINTWMEGVEHAWQRN